MTFTDITIVPVPVDRKNDYIAFSQRMAEVYRDHGAIRITDYWQVEDAGGQEDFHAGGLTYGEGELPDFANIIGASASEAIVVTLTEWPSREAREARDRGAAGATSAPRVLATLEENPVFDGSRVIASSFEITMSPRALTRAHLRIHAQVEVVGGFTSSDPRTWSGCARTPANPDVSRKGKGYRCTGGLPGTRWPPSRDGTLSGT